MELQYVEVENWDELNEKDIILFKLPEKQMKYYVAIGGTFCVNTNTDNDNNEIFKYLNLNAESFVENIVGYSCPKGVWPIVKSIDDLKKVIKALDDECIEKFGKSGITKFKVGDKVRILPRKGKPEDYLGTYIDEMLQYSGEIATINYINPDSKILLNSNYWVWDPKALELVDEKIDICPSNTIINLDKPETQFEAELNLFSTKKHYQLNFNY